MIIITTELFSSELDLFVNHKNYTYAYTSINYPVEGGGFLPCV